MQSFLSKIAGEFLVKKTDLSTYVFILPSRRAGVFLKREFKNLASIPMILPEIISIDEFIIKLSGFSKLDNLTLLFEFYKVYLEINSGDTTESFENFSKWAILLLQDFNEIDRNLIDAEKTFDYLVDSKRIEKLFLTEKTDSEITQNYFHFIEKIHVYYNGLYASLKKQKKGYSGFLYREAFVQLDQYSNTSTQKHIFAGFNALNKSEEKIIRGLLSKALAGIYWDTDAYYMKPGHSTGKYLLQYKEEWTCFKHNKFKWIDDQLSKPKNITVCSAVKNISQIKYIGEVLAGLEDQKNNYRNTAIVLADESLLPILLNSLPEQVKHVNITMGYKLKNIAVSYLFEALFKLYTNREKTGDRNAYFFKDFLNLLQLPFLRRIVDQDLLKDQIKSLIKNNKVVLYQNELNEILKNIQLTNKNIGFLFTEDPKNLSAILQGFLNLIDLLNDEKTGRFEKEYLLRFQRIFRQLNLYLTEYGYLTDISALYQFYKQILQNETLSFRGEPLQGLQIMGMLESRVLDFKNVIIASVNEGILPEGKKQNSFIPFDIKIEYGLPTYQEKDAIFSYHFFRLLQHSENIYLIYNSQTDDFGAGEQSRFITQLELARETGELPRLHIQRKVINPPAGSAFTELLEIEKTPDILKKLEQLAVKGFSPTLLTSYIRDPINFYTKRILQISELDTVEEDVAQNTFGSIIHEVLEELYKPYLNKLLKKEYLNAMKSLVKTEVRLRFLEKFSKESISKGKNYLSLKVAEKYILNFLKQELQEINNGKQIRILDLEKKISIQHVHPGSGLSINLYGYIDRLDEVDGVLRVLDYKTGKVVQSDLNITDWDLLTSDYKFSKSFQVLMYVYLYLNSEETRDKKLPVEGGVISFKNLKSGFIKFNKTTISEDDISNFKDQLNVLLDEIFDTSVPFIQKEIKQFKY